MADAAEGHSRKNDCTDIRKSFFLSGIEKYISYKNKPEIHLNKTMFISKVLVIPDKVKIVNPKNEVPRTQFLICNEPLLTNFFKFQVIHQKPIHVEYILTNSYNYNDPIFNDEKKILVLTADKVVERLRKQKNTNYKELSEEEVTKYHDFIDDTETFMYHFFIACFLYEKIDDMPEAMKNTFIKIQSFVQNELTPIEYDEFLPKRVLEFWKRVKTQPPEPVNWIQQKLEFSPKKRRIEKNHTSRDH